MRLDGAKNGNSIVGKGNHSVNHVQKIKPRVEQVCQELGLQYATEENAGRMYINLSGGPATMPQIPNNQANQNHGGFTNQPHYNQGQQHQNQNQGQQHQNYQGQQQNQNYNQNQNQNQQQNGNNDELEKLAKKFLPKILNKLEKACCSVM